VAASVVVSGGTGGLGSAVTQTLLDAGWRVVVPYHDERELEHAPQHERSSWSRPTSSSPPRPPR
jgi:NAD(P)-dependent dehydrogenase (short-subunit alcohol dehydrogenase family)